MQPINFTPALIAVAGIFFIYIIGASTQARRRRKLQHRLIASSANTSGRNAFRVCHETSALFGSAWKHAAWSGTGVLWLTPDGLAYEGLDAKGKAVQLRFPARNTKAEWTGRQYAGGVRSWFVLQSGSNEPQYFTADMDAGVLHNKKDTQSVLDAVNTHLLARRMGDGPTA